MSFSSKSQCGVVTAIVSIAMVAGASAFLAACDSTVHFAPTSNAGQGGASASSSSGGGASASSSGGGTLNDAGVDADVEDAMVPCSGAGRWSPLSTTNEPYCRELFAVAWTGTDLLIWGGAFFDPETLVQPDGARYRANADTWTAISTNGVLGQRYYAANVWTGDRWVIWGGSGVGGTLPSDKAGISYNPATDVWATISSTAAPMGRLAHAAIWTGSEMIIWGGFNESVRELGDGARYSPMTDSWTPMNSAGAPMPRNRHTAIWSGNEMIVWGGRNEGAPLGDGGVYDPMTDQWRPISMIGAPSARYEHSAVWTGSELVIWGGKTSNTTTPLGDGGRYDPQTDTWASIAMTGAPTPRAEHTAVWTGAKMVVWGGYSRASETSDWTRTNTGGIYDLQSDTWTPTSTCDAPRVTAAHAAVWTGNEMLVWGGNGCAHGHRFVP